MEEKDEAAVGQIIAAASALGWSISVPNSGDDPVPGLCVGTDEYVQFIVAAIEAYERPTPWKR